MRNNRFFKPSSTTISSYRSKLTSLLWSRTVSPPLPIPPPPPTTNITKTILGIERVDPFTHLNLNSGHRYLQQETELLHHSLQNYKGLLGEITEVCEVASKLIPYKKSEDMVVVGEWGDCLVVREGDEGDFFVKDKFNFKKTLLFRTTLDLITLIHHSTSSNYVDSSSLKLLKLGISRNLRYLTVTIKSTSSEEVGDLFLIDRFPTNNHNLITVGDQVNCQLIKVIPRVYNFLIINDEQVVFTKVNPQLRPYKVQRFKFHTREVEEVFEEVEDTSQFVDIGLTRDNSYLTINSNSLTTSTIRVCSTLELSKLYLFHSPVLGVECFVDHIKDHFVILSNYSTQPKTRSFQLYTIKDQPQLLPNIQQNDGDWATQANLIKLDDLNNNITDIELFSKYAVIYSLDSNGNPKVAVYEWETEQLREVSGIPEIGVLQPSNLAQNFGSEYGSIKLSSPIHPPQHLSLNFHQARVTSKVHFLTSQSWFRLTYSSRSKFRRGTYKVYKVTAPSPQLSSPSIPITIIETSLTNQESPVLMVGYGAYGVNLNPEFRPHYFPLLHRGWKIALVHIRGGSELGSQWYEKGRATYKLNSSKDFLTAAHYFKSPNRHLVASATSAGAVAVAGAVHRQPDLFSVMTLRVPFLNVLDSMLDPTSPLTEVEYNEWGNPTKNLADLKNILNYSPYDTLSKLNPTTSFPATLIIGGLLDQRVDPLSSLKYLARLRQLFFNNESSKDHLLLHLDPHHGHHIEDPDAYYKSVAQELEFILKHTATNQKIC